LAISDYYTLGFRLHGLLSAVTMGYNRFQKAAYRTSMVYL